MVLFTFPASLRFVPEISRRPPDAPSAGVNGPNYVIKKESSAKRNGGCCCRALYKKNTFLPVKINHTSTNRTSYHHWIGPTNRGTDTHCDISPIRLYRFSLYTRRRSDDNRWWSCFDVIPWKKITRPEHAVIKKETSRLVTLKSSVIEGFLQSINTSDSSYKMLRV